LHAVRRERQFALRRYLLLTSMLAAAFVVVQAPSLWRLLEQHQHLRQQGVAVYGLIFFLILVHALHVVGGIIALAVVTINALRGRYDHESHNAVKHAAMYWHFLDAVWLIMFFGMIAMG
jgi:cytochrome c oxidase subunit III